MTVPSPAPIPASTSSVVIPPEAQSRFPDLIALILGSESMNNEERQYWINILFVMTPEQRTNLKDILETEKHQLQEIDKKYAKEIGEIDSKQLIEKTREERSVRRLKRVEEESAAKQSEDAHAEDILKSIQSEK
ncbi:MAG: hypothetical protein PHH13_02745 [Candidatus Peribacteraceae bacterium]|nr:hypothetical protein [Candidatus Peribacteraceae bacterium]